MSESEIREVPSRKRPILYGGLVFIAVVLIAGLWLASRPARPALQGEVDADSINISTKALSRMDRLLVQEGDRVRAGQLLAELSSPEIVNGQRQAQAALDSARAAQSLTNEGTRSEDIESLRATWLAAQANADLARTSSVRADRLYAQGVIAAQRRDEANAARDSSARAAEAARAQYRKALTGVRPQSRDIAQAQVRIAAATVASAQALTDETRLVAPIAGEVARRFVNPGELVSPVIPALQLIDIDHPYVLLNIREEDYAGLRAGAVLEGEVPALRRTVRFRVRHIAPQGEFATFRAERQTRGYDMRAFEVKLVPEGEGVGLRPGMSVLFNWPR
ncbi:HlyD family secretion protein [Sphingomonas silueang]|jgi:HlyD family secretion protein|uniref:HlyD family secretion protein n=1 Tax=Sphingomonas silueang TaxID=3156617 RepID=UPI0032B3EA2C